MKNLKLSCMALAALALAFTACKKDNSNTPSTPENSFVVNNGLVYKAHNATYKANGPSSILSLSNTTDSTAIGAVNINMVKVNFKRDSIPSTGTFSYKHIDSTGFDSTKNFDYVMCGYGMTHASPNPTGGTKLDTANYKLAGSTIKISNTSGKYTIIYNLKFTKKVGGQVVNVAGRYSGGVRKQG